MLFSRQARLWKNFLKFKHMALDHAPSAFPGMDYTVSETISNVKGAIMPSLKQKKQQANQGDLLSQIKTIKMMFVNVLKKNGGVGRVEKYSGPESRMRALRLILDSLNSLIENPSAIQVSNVSSLCARLKSASDPECDRLSVRTIGRESIVSAGKPVASRLFESKLVEERILTDSIQKGLQDILRSNEMNELRSRVGLPAMCEMTRKP